MPRKPRSTVNDSNAILAQALLEEREEKRQEKENAKRAKEVALAQIHQTERENEAKAARMQSVCDHLLGNHRIGVIPNRKACALHKDYFSDKSVRIYCGKCRAEWHPGDKSDLWFKDGAWAANPTKKSWRQINEYFYSFENSKDLTSRAFRIEQVEPEDMGEPESVSAA